MSRTGKSIWIESISSCHVQRERGIGTVNVFGVSFGGSENIRQRVKQKVSRNAGASGRRVAVVVLT